MTAVWLNSIAAKDIMMASDSPLPHASKVIAHFAGISAVDARRHLIFGLWILAPLVGVLLVGAVMHFLA